MAQSFSVNVSDVEQEPELWEFVFDDGARIVSCVDHQWLTFDVKQLTSISRKDPEWRAKRRDSRPSRAKGNKSSLFNSTISQINSERAKSLVVTLPTGSVRTTREIISTLKTESGRTNHAIPVQPGLEAEHIRLPIDPYTLGAWLGDGHSNGGGFTGIDEEIWLKVEAVGYDINHKEDRKAHHIYGISGQLRSCGLLNNKHIPPIYLRASRDQRLELLRGLMDTDGTIHKPSHMPEFCNTNKRIVDGVLELVTSLGWKCFVREGRAMLRGKDCGPKWTITFSPTEKVFHLPRKADIQKLATRRTTKFRYIVEANKVTIEPGRCIQVDSPSHMYLAGDHFIPTHNSHLLRVAAITSSLEVPGLQTYLFRRQSTDLQKNHVEGPSGFPLLLAKFIQNDLVKIVYNPKVEISFKNGPTGGYEGGSKIFLCHCKDENDKYSQQGAEIHQLLLDELTHFTETIYTFLRARVRMVGIKLPPHVSPLKYPRVMCGSNPGNIGHGLVKQAFIDGVAPMEIRQMPKIEGGMRRQYIPAKLSDNPSLMEADPDYANRLMGLGNEALVKAMLDGDWDVFVGQAFNFSPKYHVIKPMEVPRSAPIYMAFDWGYGAPFSVGWFWVDGDGRVYMCGEWYGWNGKPNEGLRYTDSQIAAGILEREEQLGLKGRDIQRLAGPDCFSKKPDYRGGGQGPSTSEVFSQHGIFLRPGDPDKRAKLRQFYERLRVPAGGTPPMFLVYDTCRQFIRTIPTLTMKEDNPEMLEDHGAEDHCYEMACHIFMARPMGDSERKTVMTREQQLIESWESGSATETSYVAGVYGGEMQTDPLQDVFGGSEDIQGGGWW